MCAVIGSENDVGHGQPSRLADPRCALSRKRVSHCTEWVESRREHTHENANETFKKAEI